MPSVFCQFSISESRPAVRISSMSEQVRTGRSHDLQQHNVSKSGQPACTLATLERHGWQHTMTSKVCEAPYKQPRAQGPLEGSVCTPEMVEASHGQVWW